MASNPSASACCANSTAFEAGGMIRPGAPSVTRIGSMVGECKPAPQKNLPTVWKVLLRFGNDARIPHRRTDRVGHARPAREAERDDPVVLGRPAARARPGGT